MRLGIVSDTHDNRNVVARAVEIFDESADAVVHCGDFVAPFSATPFDSEFRFFAVRGNNDGEWALGTTIGEFGAYLGEMSELDFAGRSFAVYHGTSQPIVDALASCGEYDYVLHGHTHERRQARVGETVVLNPGGIDTDGVDDGEPPAAVLLDVQTGETEWHDLR